MSARAFCYRSLVAKFFAAPGIATVCSKVLAARVLAFITMSSASTAFAHGVTFKMHHDQPVDSAFQQDYLGQWARKIHDESGARINLLISAGDSENGGSAILFQMAKERASELDGRGLKGESLIGKARELLAEYDTAN